jgi:hypothetical protein
MSTKKAKKSLHVFETAEIIQIAITTYGLRAVQISEAKKQEYVGCKRMGRNEKTDCRNSRLFRRLTIRALG